MSRQEWGRQKLTIIETTESNDSKKMILENELKSLTDNYIEYKRHTATRETELQGKINAFEDVLKTTKAHTDDVRQQLEESREQITKTKHEAGLQLQIAVETCCQLERDLEAKRQEWEDERRRLDICLENERRDASESRDKYERWREHHALALKQVSDENNSKISALENEKRKKEEAFRTEIEQSQLLLQQNTTRMDQLKIEANNLRNKVQDTNNAFSALRHDVEREDRELNFAQAQYYEELKQLAASVEDAKRNELALTKQHDAMKLRSEIEQKRLEKELQETRAIGERTLAEANMKLSKFKANYQAALAETQNRYLEDLQNDRDRIEALGRENEQLRQFLAGGNSNNVIL